MTDGNIPSDKHSANIYLRAKKLAYLELIADILDSDMTTTSQISGLIYNKLEVVDNELENY